MRNKNWIEFNHKTNNNDNLENKVVLSQSKNLKIHKERKGKKGKTVTIISGFKAQNTLQLGELLKKLKVYCGTGGSLNEKVIQLQGDMQERVKIFLRKEGYLI